MLALYWRQTYHTQLDVALEADWVRYFLGPVCPQRRESPLLSSLYLPRLGIVGERFSSYDRHALTVFMCTNRQVTCYDSIHPGYHISVQCRKEHGTIIILFRPNIPRYSSICISIQIIFASRWIWLYTTLRGFASTHCLSTLPLDPFMTISSAD